MLLLHQWMIHSLLLIKLRSSFWKLYFFYLMDRHISSMKEELNSMLKSNCQWQLAFFWIKECDDEPEMIACSMFLLRVKYLMRIKPVTVSGQGAASLSTRPASLIFHQKRKLQAERFSLLDWQMKKNLWSFPHDNYGWNIKGSKISVWVNAARHERVQGRLRLKEHRRE